MSSGASTGQNPATRSGKDKTGSMKECDESTVPVVVARSSQDLKADVAAPANDCSDIPTTDAAASANDCSDIPTTDAAASANDCSDIPTTDAAASANDCSDIPTTDAAASANDCSDIPTTDAAVPAPSGADKANTSASDNPSMISIDGRESVKEDAREAFQDASEADKYILVFGSTGAGKSTLINHIAGFDLPVSSDALGKTHSSKEGLFEHAGVKYSIIDTSGLNQDHRGLVTDETAETELKTLLRGTADRGLNLMIMVTRGRIAETLDNNYGLFVNTMTSNEVPLIIVQTHLDDEDDLGQWAVDNERYFKDAGHHAKQIVGTAFPKFNPRRESSDSWSKNTIQESTDRVWKAIEEHSSPTPKIFCERGTIDKLLREIWKKFKRHVVKPVKKRIGSRGVEDNKMVVANRTPRNRQIHDDNYFCLEFPWGI